MKQIYLKSGKFLLVEVPEGFFKHEIITDSADDKRVKTSDRVGDKTYSDALPPGNWSIVGKATELPEDDWKWIVEFDDEEKWMYKIYGVVYEEPDHSRLLATTNATKSGHYLIKSHGMQPETTLILKEIT